MDLALRSGWTVTNAVGIMLFVRGDIPVNLLSMETSLIKGFYVEMNL